MSETNSQAKSNEESKTQIATLAGGCFWCSESALAKVPGVIKVTSGYTGGHVENPSYEQVSEGTTGHYEAIEVEFDPSKVSYEFILDKFLKDIDPTDARGQFADKGPQYRPAIFYHDDKQKEIALATLAKLEAAKIFDKPLAVQVLAASKFYPAEDYHQDYYKKNPLHYSQYRKGSGREGFTQKAWGELLNSFGFGKAEAKTSKEDLRKKLTPIQYHVTQECGTEKPFDNPYWNNKEPGIYVDITTGEPLFSSQDKYDSGSGWPSFTKPIDEKNVTALKDTSHGMIRTEVKSKEGNAHLGHVFEDGPKPTGKRYCINSASLRFIPASKLEAEGYGEFKKLFN